MYNSVGSVINTTAGCRKSEIFVQLANLLNHDFSTADGTALLGEVADTLALLLAGNGSSRTRLKHDVGYDTLLRILLRLTGPGGPQQALLVKLMGLILEVRRFCNSCPFRS